MAVLAQGCALTPDGLRGERAAMTAAGAEFRRGPDPADLPRPVDGNDWRTFLRRGLLANGDLRAAWFEWKAAVEQVRGASAWPNTNIALGYSYLFSDSKMKTFDRMSFSAGLDTMENLSFPGKTMAAGRTALADARAAGERFRATKFTLQRRVLDAWLDLALAAEVARLSDEMATLEALAADSADAALEGGDSQADALRARMGSAWRDDMAATARAEIEASKARLAALTALPDPALVATPTRLPAARALPENDSPLLDAVDDDPKVRGLRADQRARGHEEDLARLQWIPDVNPFAMVTGSIEQGVGAAVMLPTTIVEIQSGIEVARAMRGAASARLLQARRDGRGEVAAHLAAARDAGRSRRLLEDRVLPAARSLADSTAGSYSAGRGRLGAVVEARVLVVETEREVAVATIERERSLAALEEELGADLETFSSLPPLRTARIDIPNDQAARSAQDTGKEEGR